MKTKKTTTKKNTLDPVFNESFSFNVAPSSLKSVSVIASVWDYNSKGKDNFVGQVIMGKHLSGLFIEIKGGERCHRSKNEVSKF